MPGQQTDRVFDIMTATVLHTVAVKKRLMMIRLEEGYTNLHAHANGVIALVTFSCGTF